MAKKVGEERLIELYREKKRVKEFLRNEDGDDEAIEQIEACYAQAQARLFETEDETDYT